MLKRPILVRIYKVLTLYLSVMGTVDIIVPLICLGVNVNWRPIILK